ncbi:MAG TPA: SEC-C metal-binding domain-containing protein [Roseiflexaceae bacterium]|nr:SEC-C metal-binding domain-containing protein [Roseiflexaceae bacterium]
MAKVGRNDPCPCGSGKKYKNCHLPLEEAARSEQLRLRRAVDTLLPKVIEAARALPGAIPAAFQRYWDGKYGPEQLAELDDLEDRGADRFLTWFAFDYPQEDGRTLVERLAADPSGLEVTPEEARLLPGWAGVRLRAYVVDAVQKGQSLRARDLLDEQPYTVADSAASRRMAVGEVLVGHLLPAGDTFFVGGAAAHLTADTREKLRAFMDLHLEAMRRERPEATFADLRRERSEVLNHFVMQLPVEAPDPTLLENILMQTRIALRLAGESVGLKDEG